MAARDGAASIQGDAIRITALNMDGSIDLNKPVLTTNGFISASFGTEFEDGDEISEKAADGSICIQYKASDSMKGITFNLSLCSPDPEASALIAGGQIICSLAPIFTVPGDPTSGVCQAAGTVIGYTSPPVGALVGNPIAVEIWSKAIVKGKPASGTPYFHWVFPYVRVRYEGDREFTNGALANEFSGTGTGNDQLAVAGLGGRPQGAADDYRASVPGGVGGGYSAALVNPFSYVRSTSLPAFGWSTDGWTYTPDNSLGCAPVATGATETVGAAGVFTPAGAMAPSSLSDLQAGIPAVVIADPTTGWTKGSHVLLADGTQAHWNGTAWAIGPSLGVLTATVTLGLTANSTGVTPGPAAETGGGSDGGVRVVPARDAVEVPVAELTGVDWGDGDTTFDTTGGYIAHVYKTVQDAAVVKLTHIGTTAETAPFDVVAGTPTGATEVAGTSGTWTPAGVTAAADLAAMASVTATPATTWGTGSHMVLGDASTAYWDATAAAWQTGAAP